MGTLIQFTCDKCEYSAGVSGGRGVGMVAVVQTMSCSDCKELVDVLIGRFGGDGPTGDSEYDKDLGVCPQCKSKSVPAWADSEPCPKCEGAMVAEGPPLCWD